MKVVKLEDIIKVCKERQLFNEAKDLQFTKDGEDYRSMSALGKSLEDSLIPALLMQYAFEIEEKPVTAEMAEKDIA